MCFSAGDIVKRIGRVVLGVRRCVEYMICEGELDKGVKCGENGRPQHKYKKL